MATGLSPPGGRGLWTFCRLTGRAVLGSILKAPAVWAVRMRNGDTIVDATLPALAYGRCGSVAGSGASRNKAGRLAPIRRATGLNCRRMCRECSDVRSLFNHFVGTREI